MGEIEKLSSDELESLREQLKMDSEEESKERSTERSTGDAPLVELPIQPASTKEIVVEVAEDAMSASVWLADPGDEEYSVPEIVGEMRKRKVIMGIMTDVIADMLKHKKYDTTVVVAQGKELVEGQEGYFEYFFQTEVSKTPTIREDGTVDYGAMGRLANVQEGDLIAKYHPAVQGTNGVNVCGAERMPKMARDLAPLRGKYIERDDATGEYHATMSGKISLNSGNIEILNVHEINDDVTLVMGKVEFYGDLVINGNVEAGVFIRAGRNITINGTVGAATINAGGDIVLQKGIQGGGKGKVSARGNIFSDFIEYATIEARQDVYANSIINSEINTNGNVVVSGKFGSIIGGNTHGLRGITTNAAGNISEIKTYLHSGYKEEDYQKYADLSSQEKKMNKDLDDIVGDMTKILKVRNQGGTILKTQKLKVLELNKKKSELCTQIEDIKKRKEELARKMAESNNSAITVRGNIYRNVTICIDVTKLNILQTETFTRYQCRNGRIERRTVSAY